MATNPNAAQQQWKDFAAEIARSLKIDWVTYDDQIQLESGWKHYWDDGTIKTSPTGSKGLGQINSKFYPPEKWTDPIENLRFSLSLMRGYLDKFGSYRKALAAYNWGPGNVGGYTKDGLVHPAWDGTRGWRCPHQNVVASCKVTQMHHYLDVILGSEWKEPYSTTTPPVPTPEPHVPTFQFGFKELADKLGPAVVGTPISDEIYITPDFSVQYTTTGKMEYTKQGNKTYFFLATQG